MVKDPVLDKVETISIDPESTKSVLTPLPLKVSLELDSLKDKLESTCFSFSLDILIKFSNA
jgi:hypothetical protein